GKKLKIGIVGCGAIGTSLAKTIYKDFKGQAVLSGFYDIDPEKSARLSKVIVRKDLLIAGSLKKLITNSDLVIESASAKSSWDIAGQALRSGRDILIMSVGGVINHYKELSILAKKYNAKVYIPSGAISGVDALKAAGISGIKSVTLTTIKNPVSFKGVRYVEDKKIDLSKIKKDTVLFSGSAKEAVNFFPQNINVAAILSLAGIGQVKTKIKIIASPSVTRNVHQIAIDSNGGTISCRTENVLHPDNPKTSFLAFLSAVAMLKNILSPVRIGT
ncbi:MAG: aspartate dehydrogenase, partial [Candidatus Omnitrophica bacterium]|nr:aspartate dehydrogenase [Candidatus Omnitrophota bacterium]